LKILSKLREPLGECDVKEFPNITGSVNPQLLELSYDYSFQFIWLQNCANYQLREIGLLSTNHNEVMLSVQHKSHGLFRHLAKVPKVYSKRRAIADKAVAC